MTSGQQDEVRRRHILLSDELITETTIKRTKILSGVKTPFDNLLTSENARIQYYLDLVKIRIALSSGSIALSDAYAAMKLIEDDPEFVVGNTFGPLPETWTPDMIAQIINSIKILQKSKAINASNTYAAIIHMLRSASPAVPPKGFLGRVLSYFIYHPLASFTKAAKDLECHRSTVKTGFAQLEKLHRIMALGLLNGCHFGIKAFTVFFEMADENEWNLIRDSILSFPFTKTLHRVTTSSFGFVSFAIPGSQRNQNKFRSSINEVAKEFFSYCSVHAPQSLTRIVNPGLMHDGSWRFPEYSLDKDDEQHQDCTPAISSIGCLGYLDELTKDDFITSEISGYHLRKSASEIASIMKSRGYNYRASQIAYRIHKLIKLEVMDPWLWYSGIGLHYNFTIEIVSNSIARSKIFEGVSSFPEVFTSATDRGAIIWLDIPQYHLKNYYDFLAKISKLSGVDRIRPILAVNRSGGKNYIDIFENLEFGDRGFSNASDDVDLAAYLFS